ncbi:MAG: UDP-N-acetylmuramoyl-tripeptide--D-alanyl-D-alanine ligase, partial [Clostridia bacterium]|nr:UDP-N-acetylmuramoyl-tripeptide--D-alanyl-D-alanine ligase [Clostridia bacterium]
ALAGYLIRRQGMKQKEKKPFALTARVKRLYGALAFLLILIPAVIYGILHLTDGNGLWFLCPLAGVGLACLLPLLAALAGAVAWPIERLIFHLYFRDAEKKLMKNPRLIRIGITGSYGKTSTKFILAEILSQKYNVLATPASFNTPMGVTRIIRERLTPAHQVFIGEMGARHVGEIKELSRLVHPQIGLLTAVGPQHLDTFKTIQRIEKTKYELIDALPEDGLAVFLSDDAIVTKLYEKTEKPKLLCGKEGADAWAEDVSVSPQGSHFTLRLKGWEPFACDTVLLGRHNISNILMAAAVAKNLGLTKEQIARGIRALKPVEHRLQLMKTPGGVTVIDDAFNTNPRSSKEALKVLSSFPGRRIIVTPGMVELGAEEEQYNREFGRAMASSVDVAVLVGKRHTASIQEGLTSAGFPAESIRVAASLTEAVAIVNALIRPGDVVMYENDLPDNYNEG